MKLTRNLFLYQKLVGLYITFRRVRATPANEIKKMKLRQIFKEAEKIKDKMEKRIPEDWISGEPYWDTDKKKEKT